MPRLDTIEDQVGFLEKQAAALHLELGVKMDEFKRLRTELRKLKLLHAEKFYGMTAAECLEAYNRIQALVSQDFMDPLEALDRRNDENPGKELRDAQYQELMLTFADNGFHG